MYAVKIGEIHLRSDKPISAQQLERAQRCLLTAAWENPLCEEGLAVVHVIGDRNAEQNSLV